MPTALQRSQGGKNAASAMTAEERRERGKRAVTLRWQRAREQRAMQEKLQQELPGPSPYLVAKNDPGRRWSQSLHNLLVLMRSVREYAGGDILLLTMQWSPEARLTYRRQLQAVHAMLETWIAALAVEGKE